MSHILFLIQSIKLTPKFILTFILFAIVLYSINSYGHDTGARIVDGIITGKPVHQHISKEAGNAWADLPSEIAFRLTKPIDAPLDVGCFANYDPGYDDIVTGSADEDQEWTPGCPTLGPYNRGYLEHFWDPDEPNISSSGTYEYGAYDYGYEGDVIVLSLTGVLRFSSAYRKAQELWDKKAICHYIGYDKYGNTCTVDKDQAYYWLGRIAHLLEDMTVPAHVHNVPHNWASDIYMWTSSDPFEHYIGDVFPVFLGIRYQTPGPYKHEDLPGINLQRDFTDPDSWWRELHPNPTNLFKLFWYTAQKTQYYASGGTVVERRGDPGYKKLSGQYVGFQPSLWAIEGVAPIAEPTDIPAKLQEMAKALMPHALRAVAGLYRLFWFETHLISPCHQYTSSTPISSIPQGFGVPWDTQSGANELLIKATCTTSSATIDLGRGNPLQIIYKTGYHYGPGLTTWQPISYTSSEQLINNTWFPKTARGAITTDTSVDNYVLAYICTWTNNQWKCGCQDASQDASCAQSYWQIQQFKQ